jgi:hypothetical protein
MFPDPANLAKEAKKDDAEVEQLGTITLEELHKYNCNNEERRLLSLFGIIFDVTSSEKGYGKNGACKFSYCVFLTAAYPLLMSLHTFSILDKEYAGHDITLAIGLMKTDEQWLDRFVKMEPKWKDDAQGWVEYMDAKYTRCAKLDKWDEDPESWPELTEEEKEAINKCVIM